MSAKETQNGRTVEDWNAKDDCLLIVLSGLVSNGAILGGIAALSLLGLAGILLPMIALLVSVPSLYVSIQIGKEEPWMEALYGEDWEELV